VELKSEGNILLGNILLQGGNLFEGRVEIGAYHDDKLLGTEWAWFKDKIKSIPD
jgi:hypothetical protein